MLFNLGRECVALHLLYSQQYRHLWCLFLEDIFQIFHNHICRIGYLEEKPRQNLYHTRLGMQNFHVLRHSWDVSGCDIQIHPCKACQDGK